MDGCWPIVHQEPGAQQEGSVGQRAQLHLQLPIAPCHSHHHLSYAPTPSMEKLSA